MAKLNEKGQEVLDPTPVVLDVGPRPLPLVDRIKRAVKHELSEMAQNTGYESFEEANDFDIEDQFSETDHISGYEVVEMQEEEPDEARLATTGQSEATPQGAASDNQEIETDLSKVEPNKLTDFEQQIYDRLHKKIHGSPPDNNQ